MLSGVTLSTFNIFSRGAFKADECKDTTFQTDIWHPDRLLAL